MMFKKNVLLIAVAGLMSMSAHSEVLHGALSGMSGAGYATGNYSEGVLLNPSLGASYNPEKDSFALLLSVGVNVSDPNELIDQADSLTELTDDISAANTLTTDYADELKLALRNIDGDTATLSFGGSAVIAIPNKYVSAAIIAKATGGVYVHPNIDSADLSLIDASVDTDFDPDTQLLSSVHSEGAVLTELGVALSKSFDLKNGNYILVGLTPKQMEVESIVYAANVSSFDEDDFDADQYTYTDDAFGLDVGATYIVNKMRYGFTISNIVENDFETIDPNRVISVEPQATASVGYINGNLKTEASFDVNAAPMIGKVGESQFFRAGIEYSAFDFFRVRAGFARDIKDNVENSFSVGLGFGALNFAYIKGYDDGQGVVVSGGIRF